MPSGRRGVRAGPGGRCGRGGSGWPTARPLGPGGGRIQVVGGGEPVDRQAIGSEAGRPHGGHAGQVVRTWPAVAANSLVSWTSPRRCRPGGLGGGPGHDPAAQPGAGRHRVGEQPPPAVHPEPSRGLGEATGRSSLQRPHRWWTAGEGGRTGQDRLADRVLQGQRAAMAGWGRQARAQGLELVVQPLLEGLAVGDQPAPVTNRSQQGIDGVGGGWPPGALAGQPDQRRTITIVGLGARQPSWVRAAWVSDGANSRTDPGQRRSSSAIQA